MGKSSVVYAHPINGLQLMGENGLTKREWIAAVVASGMSANYSEERIVERAVSIADRIIKHCAETENQKEQEE